MPKFLAGIVIVKTFTTFANTDEEAREFIKKWQEGDSEEPEPGIKVTRYKMEWEEGVQSINPAPERDKVLASFLDLMQNQIPGMLKIQLPPKKEKSRIIHPFKKNHE